MSNTTTSNRRRTGVVSSLLTNKVMNADVYAKRREVISLIYAAKALVPNLPRITVRIAENHENVLGCARPGENIIWITEDSVTSRLVVFHEILHAVYRQQHVKGCPLMAPARNGRNPSDAEIDQLFRHYAFMIR